ncbi:MAG: hypothetical protein AB8B55_21260 [Mariniblastus sp.]
MIVEEDIQLDDQLITPNVRSSGLAFAVSLIVHLLLFLILAMVLFQDNKGGPIFLEVGEMAALADEEDDLNEVAFEMDLADADATLEMEEEVVEEVEEPFEIPDEVKVDWALGSEESENKTDPMEAADGMMAIEGGGTGAKQGGGGKGFFGIEAQGNKVVYIIDRSPSMDEGIKQRRYDRAVNEVMNSVNQLKPDQEFLVILFCFDAQPMDIRGRGKYCLPTPYNKDKLERWLRRVPLDSGTDPREALVMGLKKSPSCCFLLSDGEFNGIFYNNGKYRRVISTVELARKYNRSKAPIHTIGLEDTDNQRDMNMIAKESGGSYKFVPAEE